MSRMTYSVRKAREGSQNSKLTAYQEVGKKAVQRRAKRSRPLSESERRQLDHKRNAYEAFINAGRSND